MHPHLKQLHSLCSQSGCWPAVGDFFPVLLLAFVESSCIKHDALVPLFCQLHTGLRLALEKTIEFYHCSHFNYGVLFYMLCKNGWCFQQSGEVLKFRGK